MTSPLAMEFLKQKAKEKGIDPQYPKGYPVQDAEQITEDLINHKLNSLDTGQTSLRFKLDKIINRLDELEPKIDKILDRMRRI